MIFRNPLMVKWSHQVTDKETGLTTPSGGADRARPESIADPYDDLLATLDDGRRRGLVHRLSVGYYEGWRPSRDEVANIVARETGLISESEYLAGARSPVIAPDPRPRSDPQRSTARSNGSAPTVGQGPARPAQPTPPAGGDHRRAPAIERALPRPDIQEFTADCGELLPGLRFVVRGLSRGDWVLRAEHRCRLITLDYELVPISGTRRASAIDGVDLSPRFTAPIIVVPDSSTAPLTAEEVSNLVHQDAAGRITGSRGPWPVAAGTQELRFLIYPEVAPGRRRGLRPAGRLRVDIRAGQAHWHTVRGGRDVAGLGKDAASAAGTGPNR